MSGNLGTGGGLSNSSGNVGGNMSTSSESGGPSDSNTQPRQRFGSVPRGAIVTPSLPLSANSSAGGQPTSFVLDMAAHPNSSNLSQRAGEGDQHSRTAGGPGYQMPLYYEPYGPSDSGVGGNGAGSIFDRPQMIINGRRFGAGTRSQRQNQEQANSADPTSQTEATAEPNDSDHLLGGQVGEETSDEEGSGGNSSVLSSLLRTHPEAAGVIKSAEKYIPFILIIAAKCFFDHATGIFVFFALLVTFHHANSVVKSEVSRRARQNNWALLAVLVNLVACMIFIHFVFADSKLFTLSVFMPLSTKLESFTELLWIVAINDFMLKYVAVISKIFVVLLPPIALPYRKRGNYFLFIEMTSQLHRSLVPIQVWLLYLLQGGLTLSAGAVERASVESSPYTTYFSTFMGIILMVAYVVVKGKLIYAHFTSWRLAASKLWQCTRYGSSPSDQDLKANGGGVCPICHDSIKEPAMLHCKHIFCEECVSTWFDRERTCPMCRAQITEDPAWRDGATSLFVQLF